MSISSGDGDMAIEVLRGVVLRFFVEEVTNDVHLPIGYERRGDTYLSPAYATAPVCIDL